MLSLKCWDVVQNILWYLRLDGCVVEKGLGQKQASNVPSSSGCAF